MNRARFDFEIREPLDIDIDLFWFICRITILYSINQSLNLSKQNLSINLLTRPS